MDLTIQPPRRASNTSLCGIVALARMTDKARGHVDETIGEYIFGDASGLDKKVLTFLNIPQDDFADAAEQYSDGELSEWIQKSTDLTESDIQTFNTDLLAWEPFNDATRQKLKDRLTKYNPPNAEQITTMIQSMQLDDWGCFYDVDLSTRPPRTPYDRSIAGVYGLMRMADKARAASVDKLNGYIYDCPIDQEILACLGFSADDYQEAAHHNVNNIELSAWVKDNTQRTPSEISQFNYQISHKGPEGEELETIFNTVRDRVAPGRIDITTWFDLLDLDDEYDYGIVDLTRHAPRSAYDTSLMSLIGLARLIDKGRASLSNSLGDYFYGRDSFLDSMILKFLGISADDFQNALKDLSDDNAVLNWLQDQVDKSDTDTKSFNDKITGRGPHNTQQRAWFKNRVTGLDPNRPDITTLIAMVQLDDHITFTRQKSGV
ncbi:MAG: DUF5069 domain-containing protein [Candidatus Latescibacteria bacterium]|nr:DUF5069 domain-containing protein [Candidatus Latescibacterota bacterium]